MGFRILFIFIFSVLCSKAFADIKITGINPNGHSAHNGKFYGNPTATVTNIYGGISGNDCSALAPTTICDSCPVSITPVTESCNSKRVHDNLAFQVTFLYTTSSTTTVVPRAVLVTNDFNNGNGQAALTQSTNLGNVTAGSFTISVKWSEICIKLGAALTSCNGLNFSNKAIRIGVDTDGNGFLDTGEYNNEIRITLSSLIASGGGATSFCKTGDTATGACNFITYPGDKKVYIDNVRANCSFPTVDSSTISALRVYYQKTSVTSALDQTIASKVDLPLSGKNQATDGTSCIIGLSENEVGGLENDQTYNFALGVVDIAGNTGLVTQYTSASETLADCYDATGAESLNKLCHSATPEAINGLSNPDDEFDCFITTAAYGSAFKPKVKTFREFRNVFLKTHLFGRSLIQTYYKLSPRVADWIRQHPQSKPYVRILLWPLWVFAKLSLSFPYLFFIFLLIPLFFFCKKMKRELF